MKIIDINVGLNYSGSEKPMKKVKTELEDELRPEYDLKSLRVRKIGPERKNFFRSMVQLFRNLFQGFLTSLIFSSVSS